LEGHTNVRLAGNSSWHRCLRAWVSDQTVTNGDDCSVENSKGVMSEINPSYQRLVDNTARRGMEDAYQHR